VLAFANGPGLVVYLGNSTNAYVEPAISDGAACQLVRSTSGGRRCASGCPQRRWFLMATITEPSWSRVHTRRRRRCWRPHYRPRSWNCCAVIGRVALIGGFLGAAINSVRPRVEYGVDLMKAAQFEHLYSDIFYYAMARLAFDQLMIAAPTL
jgi:hypothetical protein